MRLYLISVTNLFFTDGGKFLRERNRMLICKNEEEILEKLNLLPNIYVYDEKIVELLSYNGRELKFEDYGHSYNHTIVRFEDCTDIE